MYPAQCVGQCCDARAKQERALLDFIVKGSGPPPPTQRIIRPERPVPVRLFYLSVSKIRPPVLWCPSRTILYIITTPAIVLRPYLNAPCTRRVHRHPNIMVRDFRTPAVPSSVRSGHVLRRPRHVPSGSSPTGRLVHNIRTTPPPTQMPE